MKEAREVVKARSMKKKPERMHYGHECPKGMVQVEFVGASPENRINDYSWKPEKSVFLEIYVDGQRFRIDVGDLSQFGKKGRGIHICGPFDFVIERTAINACNIALAEEKPTAITEDKGRLSR